MASAKQDFGQFLRWLHRPDGNVAANVRKIANVVWFNFDAVAATSLQRSARSVLLADLCRRLLSDATDGLPDMPAAVQEGDWPWLRLKQLTLGPFRGFRSPEIFDLTRRVALLYGPNGSGKSSFCEGLEYGLLGTVDEASTKRIEANLYLANIHEGRFAPPQLTATGHDGQDVAVTANADTFRFCFVEKNRIDAFSRIAARPVGSRAELIATLFGTDKFNDFVGNFNESMDPQLVLGSTKQTTLATRRAGLAPDQARVNGEQAELLALDSEEAALAAEYAVNETYGGLKRKFGTPGVPGRLQELDLALNSVPAAALGVSRGGLTAKFTAADEAYVRLGQLDAQLDARSRQVSFKDMYTAVVALKETEGDHCPACDTPLVGDFAVRTNPYDKASAGLEQLRELAEIQGARLEASEALKAAASLLAVDLKVLGGFATQLQEQHSTAGIFLAGVSEALPGNWWAGAAAVVESLDGPHLPILDGLLDLAGRAEVRDEASRLAHQQRQPSIEERQRLVEFQLRVQAQDLKRRQVVDAIAAARARVNEFETTNAALIREAAQEVLDVQRDQPIKLAYDRFLALLKGYKASLPGTLMAGLNDRAMNLYNEFNRDDLDADKIASLHLPILGTERIDVTFRGRPQTRVDALRILSEGHIRCLGLAILLAKALSIDSPVIVFDDIINAIDTEHRSGIRQTIFESGTFEGTQLVVTCHSLEFMKDIQQHMLPARGNEFQSFTFLNHRGDYQPRIHRDMPSLNYVLKARTAKDLADDREALGSARQALEMLAEKTWRWMVSHDLGLISVQLPGVGAEPALRNLIEALRRRLRDAAAFAHPNKAPLVAALDRFLGIPAPNLVWTYLNKGIHEEANREDYDGALVEEVVQTLETMATLDLRPGR